MGVHRRTRPDRRQRKATGNSRAWRSLAALPESGLDLAPDLFHREARKAWKVESYSAPFKIKKVTSLADLGLFHRNCGAMVKFQTSPKSDRLQAFENSLLPEFHF